MMTKYRPPDGGNKQQRAKAKSRSVGFLRVEDVARLKAAAMAGISTQEFKPLVVKRHFRQDDIDAFKAIPSLRICP
jgi:hypothetical protein